MPEAPRREFREGGRGGFGGRGGRDTSWGHSGRDSFGSRGKFVNKLNFASVNTKDLLKIVLPNVLVSI